MDPWGKEFKGNKEFWKANKKGPKLCCDSPEDNVQDIQNAVTQLAERQKMKSWEEEMKSTFTQQFANEAQENSAFWQKKYEWYKQKLLEEEQKFAALQTSYLADGGLNSVTLPPQPPSTPTIAHHAERNDPISRLVIPNFFLPAVAKILQC